MHNSPLCVLAVFACVSAAAASSDAATRIRIMPPDGANIAAGQRVEIRVEATSDGTEPPRGLMIGRNAARPGDGMPANSSNFMLRGFSMPRAGTLVIEARTADGAQATARLRVEAWNAGHGGFTRAQHHSAPGRRHGRGPSNGGADRLTRDPQRPRGRPAGDGRPRGHRHGDDRVAQLDHHRLVAGHGRPNAARDGSAESVPGFLVQGVIENGATGCLSKDGCPGDTGAVPHTISGHTATDVPLSASGPGAWRFTLVYENTDVFMKVLRAAAGPNDPSPLTRRTIRAR